MLTPSPPKALLLIDQLGAWAFTAIAFAITLLFALAYWAVSINWPAQGLQTQGGTPVPLGLLDCLYFSIVTETTLGANDVQAGALAKVLISIQVFVGLALGGVVIAKITSIRGRAMRLLSYHVQGDWIEVFPSSQDGPMLSYATIYLSDNSLRYDGENFDFDGNPLGFFRSELIDVDGPILRFRYSNRESDTTFFAEGTAALRFVETEPHRAKRPAWERYHGTMHDFLKQKIINYEGFRPTPEEANAFHGRDLDARRAAIRAHVMEVRVTRDSAK